jgi:hypothetical protein
MNQLVKITPETLKSREELLRAEADAGNDIAKLYVRELDRVQEFAQRLFPQPVDKLFNKVFRHE